MPMTLKLLKEMPEELLASSNSTVTYYVCKFLKDHPDEAFTKEEVLTSIQDKPLARGKIGKNVTYNTLSKLYHDPKQPVHKKGVYFFYELVVDEEEN